MNERQAISSDHRHLSALNFFTSLGDHFGAGIAGKGFSLALTKRVDLRLGIDVSDDFDWRIHIDSAREASILQQLANKPLVPEHPSFVRGSLVSRRWSCPIDWPRANHRRSSAPSTPGRFISHIFFECERLTSSEIDWLNESDIVTTGSNWSSQVLSQNGLTEVATVHQGVELDTFRPADERLRRPAEWEGKFLVFTGGKFEYRKGVDLAIAAFAKFLARHRNAFLLINAFNPWPVTQLGLAFSPHFRFREVRDYPGDFERMLVENGIPSSAFQVLTPTSRRELAGVMTMSDCGLFPIRCEGGTNHFLMEYMACGRPLIGTHNTGLTDILRPDENCVALRSFTPVPVNFDEPDSRRGTWHEPSVDEIVEGLERLYASRDVGDRLAKRGLHDIQEFSWSRCADKLIKVIQGAIAETSAATTTRPDCFIDRVADSIDFSRSKVTVNTRPFRHLIMIADESIDQAAPSAGRMTAASIRRLPNWSVSCLEVDTARTGYGAVPASVAMHASMRAIGRVLAEIAKQIEALPQPDSKLTVIVRTDLFKAQRWINTLGRAGCRNRLFLVLNLRVDRVPLAPEFGSMLMRFDAMLMDSKFASRAVKAMLAESNFVFTGPIAEVPRSVMFASENPRDSASGTDDQCLPSSLSSLESRRLDQMALKTGAVTLERDRVRREWFRVGCDTILIGCHLDEQDHRLGMILHLFQKLIGQSSDKGGENSEAECKWRLHVMGRGRTRENPSIMIDYRRRLGLESLVSIGWLQANPSARFVFDERKSENGQRNLALGGQLQCLDIFLDLDSNASLNPVLAQACIRGLPIVATDYGEVAECFANRIPLVPVATWRLESSGCFEPLPDIPRALKLIEEYASSIARRAEIGRAANAAIADWRRSCDDRGWVGLLESFFSND